MTHVVLGNAAVEIPVDTGLNGDIQGRGGAAVDIGPGLPIVGAALPLIGHPVAAGRYSESGGAARGAVVVFRLGSDHHRRLPGKGGQLPPVFPAKGPPFTVIVAGGVANGVIGDGFSVIGGQKILPLRVSIGVGVSGLSIGRSQNIAHRIVGIGIAVRHGRTIEATDSAALRKQLVLIIVGVGGDVV